MNIVITIIDSLLSLPVSTSGTRSPIFSMRKLCSYGEFFRLSVFLPTRPRAPRNRALSGIITFRQVFKNTCDIDYGQILALPAARNFTSYSIFWQDRSNMFAAAIKRSIIYKRSCFSKLLRKISVRASCRGVQPRSSHFLRVLEQTLSVDLQWYLSVHWGQDVSILKVVIYYREVKLP